MQIRSVKNVTCREFLRLLILVVDPLKWNNDQIDQIADTSGQYPTGVHNCLHTWWRFSISPFNTSYTDHDLTHCNEKVLRDKSQNWNCSSVWILMNLNFGAVFVDDNCPNTSNAPWFSGLYRTCTDQIVILIKKLITVIEKLNKNLFFCFLCTKEVTKIKKKIKDKK